MAKRCLMKMEALITERITTALKPTFLSVVNESYKHNVPKGSESHFSVTVVSPLFDGKSPLQRSRMVNGLLKDELATSIHAFSVKARTPQQWEKDGKPNDTPSCLGGNKL
eukprot:m.29844 g.29844  ORF g.29844 m.29844 type:complete len:110 (+) comp9604_c1_seq2:62-391(+)